VKRIVLLGVIGLVLLTGALVLNHYLNREPLDPVPATATSAGTTPEADAESRPTIEAPSADTGAAPPDTSPDATPSGAVVQPEAPPVDAAAPVTPTFDIVRVNPDGDAVIAGRAEPNADVTVRDGGTVIGEVKADDRGEWVLVPNGPLPPGSRELGVEARSEDGSIRRSESVVILSVPDKASGGAPGGGAGGTAPGTLAVVVPRGELGPSRVLQRPEPSESAAPTASPAASGTVELSVGTIDYDDKGRIALSGTANPGSTVEVEVDEKPVGTATADGAGEWRMAPKDDVPPGRYTLQVTEKDGTDGRRLARVRLPFARAEPIGDLPPGTVVVVQPGNSLWRIARSTYGDGMRYTVIFSANAAQIQDPDLIYPGQIFSLPRAN